MAHTNEQPERWKPVAGYEGLYEVSDWGRVRSLARTVVEVTGKVRHLEERIRVPAAGNPFGHLVVGLNRNGTTKFRRVHHLVLEAFVGPCPPGHECRHFPDSNPKNNHLENLRWGTPTENHADKIIHGTTNRGERNGQSKLTAEDVLRIRARLDRGECSQVQIAREYQVDNSTVSNIATRTRWAWLEAA